MLLSAGAMVGVLLCQRVRAGAWALGFVAALAIGALAWLAGVAMKPAALLSATERADSRAGAIVTVEGIVVDSPSRARQMSSQPWIHQQPRWQFDLALRAEVMNNVAAAREGTLRVRVAQYDSSMALRAGDRVRIMGKFEPPPRATNPGEPDRESLARGKGLAGTLALSSPELITRVDEMAHAHTLDDLYTWILKLRDRGKLAVSHSLPESSDTRWLVESLLLGESETRDDEAMSILSRVGVIHLVAISGFHLTVIAMVMLWLMRLLGDRGWLEPVLVALGLVLYALLTPLSPALIRAVVLTLFVLASQSTGRKADSLCLLGIGAIGIVLVQPWAAMDLGFQLSLGLTALLLWAQPAFAARFANLPPKGVLHERLAISQWVWRGARVASASSVMCWIVSLPWMMTSVGIVSPAGLIASLVLSPVFVLLFVLGTLFALASSVLGAFFPAAALWCTEHATGPLLSFLAHIVLVVTKWFDSVPGAWMWTPTTPTWWSVLACASLALWVRFGFKRTTPNEIKPGLLDLMQSRTVITSLLLLSLCLLPIAWQTRTKLAHDVRLRIDMLDVGDGTCMLLRTQDAALLWDAKHARWARTQPGVLAACRELGAWRVRTAIISHPDSDHCTALPDMLAPLGVQQVIVSQRFLDAASGSQPLMQDILGSVRAAGLTPQVVQGGSTFAIGEHVRAEVAWPPEPAPSTLPDNAVSLVVVLEVATTGAAPARVLLAGDMQSEPAHALAEVLASKAPFAIAEAPHHGAADAGGIALLQAARPRVVLQSTGPSRLNDPRLDEVRAAAQAWLVTARDGWAWAEILADGSIRYGSHE
jgi:competence protein ComEC